MACQTTGHSHRLPPGTALSTRENRLLFVGDIDLSSLDLDAHRCSDIDEFIKSIHRCAEIDPRIVMASHKGIITDNIQGG